MFESAFPVWGNKRTRGTSKLFLPVNPMPYGLIARKVGMSRAFLPSGEMIPVTYLEVKPNIVVRTKTKEKDGYDAVVLGVEPKMWKSRKGKEHMRYAMQKEWQVDSLDGLEAGKSISVESFPEESKVTIVGITKGKGFQGVMRRHGFHGGPGSHGSHFKREPGSVGMRGDPGRIFRGHKMAGHMGQEQRTIKNRSVIISDVEKGIIAVSGPVPGPNGAHVYLTLESSPNS
jgi:large subunit ribosomal protein L3